MQFGAFCIQLLWFIHSTRTWVSAPRPGSPTGAGGWRCSTEEPVRSPSSLGSGPAGQADLPQRPTVGSIVTRGDQGSEGKDPFPESL